MTPDLILLAVVLALCAVVVFVGERQNRKSRARMDELNRQAAEQLRRWLR